MARKWRPTDTGKNKRGKVKKKKKNDEMDEDELETLSFKKLQKMITENHPCDPDTKQRFPLSSRITVRNYYKKLFDLCCFLKL